MNKGKVLIIEDDPLVIRALKVKFAREGMEVLEAANGRDGLSLALDKKPDVILLDLVMVVMDGLTMLKQLRADPWGAKVPVVILTNLRNNQDIKAAAAAGVNSYLVKSNWRLEDVVAKIKSYLT